MASGTILVVGEAPDFLSAAIASALEVGLRLVVVGTPHLGGERLLSNPEPPDLVLCDSGGEDSRQRLLELWPLFYAVSRRAVPLLLITGWRDIVFHAGVLPDVRTPITVLLRPFEEAVFVHEVVHLVRDCCNRHAPPPAGT